MAKLHNIASKKCNMSIAGLNFVEFVFIAMRRCQEATKKIE